MIATSLFFALLMFIDPVSPFLNFGVAMASVLVCTGLSLYTVISLANNTRSQKKAAEALKAVADVSISINALATAVTNNHTQELQQLTSIAGSMKEMAETNQEFMIEQSKQMTALAMNQENLASSFNEVMRDMISAFKSAKEK